MFEHRPLASNAHRLTTLVAMRISVRITALALVSVLLILVGCGGSNGTSELISIETSGGLTGKQRNIVVLKDGKASCDDQESKKLSDKRFKEAESLAEDIEPLAKKDASYGEPFPDARQYTASVGDGTVEWFDSPDVPSVLDRAARFADGTSVLLC